ncbi:Acid protease [Mycena venus]|uniref:Acid protease n=1 Tax=Mycena venus TaxID=2733690 RepID=A0A8H6XQY1_9AGAR|nr:Acid protease [Mycena venus]
MRILDPGVLQLEFIRHPPLTCICTLLSIPRNPPLIPQFTMFNKSALLLAVTLALSVAASPSPAPAEAVARNIPLPKRSSLTRPDGVFDKDKAIAANIATINKHRQNLINLQKNKGVGAFNPGAEIKELASLPKDVEARMLRRAEKRQIEKLTDEDSDEEWAGTISIGTPRAEILDRLRHRLLRSLGPLLFMHQLHLLFQVQIQGFLVLDVVQEDGHILDPVRRRVNVTVAGVTATKQAFSPVTTLSSSFADDPVDGILGLAFPAISNLNANPFFVTANAAGKVNANQFGFYLASSGSTLDLGGTDTSKYSGDIEFIPVDSSGGFWQATGGKAKVGSSSVVTGIETIIDSGTTLAYGPPADIKKIFAKVPGSTLFDSTNGFYSYPCDSPPEISFNWGGQDWTISADNLNLGTTESGSSDCVASLAAQDLGLGTNVFLLGDAFMKNAYTVFDFDQEAVGFAGLS